MRTLLLLLAASLSLGGHYSQNTAEEDEGIIKGNSCETIQLGHLMPAPDDIQLLAKKFGVQLATGRTPLVCIGDQHGFAVSYLYDCGQTRYCIAVTIRKDVAARMGDVMPALLGHEMGHFARGGIHCGRFDDFVEYTKCEHRVDAISAWLTRGKQMVAVLNSLIAIAEEQGEDPYPNAMWGWKMRISMLEEDMRTTE